MSSFGGKNGAGVYQSIINLIPPHDTYIETHLGGGAVLRLKRPAKVNIGLDIDPQVIEVFPQSSHIRLTCGDCLTILKDYSFNGNEFIYADPPYLHETRKSQTRYRYDYTTSQHIELLRFLKGLSCKVMISGYYSELYADMLAGWHTASFEATTRSGDTATEWLWMNYPKPLELHDYRYLGRDYRERERIKRKKTRWINKLENMPILERQALLAAMSEVFAASHTVRNSEASCNRQK